MGRRHRRGLQAKTAERAAGHLHTWGQVEPRNELEQKMYDSGHIIWTCGSCDHREFRRPNNPPWFPVVRSNKTGKTAKIRSRR